LLAAGFQVLFGLRCGMIAGVGFHAGMFIVNTFHTGQMRSFRRLHGLPYRVPTVNTSGRFGILPNFYLVSNVRWGG
jgi:hypothetical protein